MDSMSPTVPPTSTRQTSAIRPSASGSAAARRIEALISSVMCGMIWTVSPRKSPRRSFSITER